MSRSCRFHGRQSGSVVLTGNMPNGRVTIVTRFNGRVTLVTRVT